MDGDHHFQEFSMFERIEARMQEVEAHRLAKAFDQKDGVRRDRILAKIATLKNIVQIGQNWLSRQSWHRAFRQA